MRTFFGTLDGSHMSDKQQSLNARFYAEPGAEGTKEPVRDWLRNLPEEERIAVGADIRIVQNHWPGVNDVKPKLVDSIRDGVWEVRTTTKDHWLRVFFGFVNPPVSE